MGSNQLTRNKERRETCNQSINLSVERDIVGENEGTICSSHILIGVITMITSADSQLHNNILKVHASWTCWKLKFFLLVPLSSFWDRNWNPNCCNQNRPKPVVVMHKCVYCSCDVAVCWKRPCGALMSEFLNCFVLMRKFQL